MHFSITQQRTAFLTEACLGAVSPCRDRLDASQLTVTTDSQGTRHLILDRENDSPLLVNPLLLGFNRAQSTASGTAEIHPSIRHSTRASGEELSWQYSLKVVQYQDEWLLIGIQNDNPAAAKLLIGRSFEEQEHPEQCSITLEPGWRLVYQTYNDEQLNHLYLVQDDSIDELTTSYGAASTSHRESGSSAQNERSRLAADNPEIENPASPPQVSSQTYYLQAA